MILHNLKFLDYLSLSFIENVVFRIFFNFFVAFMCFPGKGGGKTLAYAVVFIAEVLLLSLVNSDDKLHMFTWQSLSIFVI